MAKKKNFRNLSFVLTDADQIEFSRYYLHNSGAGKRALWTQKLIVPFMTVVVGIFMYMGGLDMKLLIGGGGIMLILSVVMWRRAEDIVLEQQIKNIEGPRSGFGAFKNREYKMDFLDDELIMEYNGEARSISYDSISKIEISDKGLYIWLDKKTAFSIPERAFQREGDMEMLFEFLEKTTK